MTTATTEEKKIIVIVLLITYIVSRTVFQISLVTGQIFGIGRTGTSP